MFYVKEKVECKMRDNVSLKFNKISCFIFIPLIVQVMFHCTVAADGWQPDLGNGEYKNPVLHADYSDPDVIKVDDDFYMVSSSFNVMPGIPILHSKDLVNWEIVGHVYDALPFEKFNKPSHGNGSWAPSIRYHDGLFYVYFCTPETGLFVATAETPDGDWTVEQIAEVELWEDPTPFWDDDGKAYLIRGKVRADILYIHRMSEDGKRLLSDGEVIYKNLERQPVIEGPKVLKRDGYYYIFAPAGGVRDGWQAVLRSEHIFGPYEDKIILHQGNTDINGPHQGGLVHLDSGEWWFLHFQEKGIYGRVVHLQPAGWKDGWPFIGIDQNGDGIGEPVDTYTKPDIGQTHDIIIPQTSDEFNTSNLGLQWQWHANPKSHWYSLNDEKPGHLRLRTVQNLTQNGNLRFVGNQLLQKFSSPGFTATTRMTFSPDDESDKAGLVVNGKSWGYLAMFLNNNKVFLGAFKGHYEQYDDATELIESVAIKDSSRPIYLRTKVDATGLYQFSYSLDNEHYVSIGSTLQAEQGVWIGAKIGVFALSSSVQESQGYADFDWFRLND